MPTFLRYHLLVQVLSPNGNVCIDGSSNAYFSRTPLPFMEKNHKPPTETYDSIELCFFKEPLKVEAASECYKVQEDSPGQHTKCVPVCVYPHPCEYEPA
jgi:hypothetical protein